VSGMVQFSVQEDCSSFVTAEAPFAYHFALLRKEEIAVAVVVAEIGARLLRFEWAK